MMDEFVYKFIDTLLRDNRPKQNTKQVVFIIVHCHPRATKIAYALKKAGYEVIALVACGTYAEDIMKDNVKYFRRIEFLKRHQWKYIEFYLLKYNPLVYHIFTCYSFNIGVKLIQAKIGKIVFDSYDGYKGFLKEADKRINLLKVKEEEFCLTNADGLCCRSFETNFQKRHFKYKFKGKRIFFPDYCWGYNLKRNNVVENYGINICYVGGIVIEKDNPQAPTAVICELAKILEQGKCDFHVFPSEYDINKHSRYIKLSKENKNFHFYKTISPRDLINTISRFDYAIHMIKENYKESNQYDYVTLAKYKYGVTNKFFDYIDAELPIIAQTPEFFCRYFNRKKVLMRYYVDDIDIENLIAKKQTFKINVKRLKKELYIERHIERLINFYKSL